MKKAIIYVRGNNEEMQEMFCRLYAKDMGYKVLFVTTEIEAVNGCDVLVVTNPSRISREQIVYYETVNALKKKGIEIECATNHDNAADNLSLIMDILK